MYFSAFDSFYTYFSAIGFPATQSIFATRRSYSESSSESQSSHLCMDLRKMSTNAGSLEVIVVVHVNPCPNQGAAHTHEARGNYCTTCRAQSVNEDLRAHHFPVRSGQVSDSLQTRMRGSLRLHDSRRLHSGRQDRAGVRARCERAHFAAALGALLQDLGR